jgi:hypothetical protein
MPSHSPPERSGCSDTGNGEVPARWTSRQPARAAADERFRRHERRHGYGRADRHDLDRARPAGGRCHIRCARNHPRVAVRLAGHQCDPWARPRSVRRRYVARTDRRMCRTRLDPHSERASPKFPLVKWPDPSASLAFRGFWGVRVVSTERSGPGRWRRGRAPGSGAGSAG